MPAFTRSLKFRLIFSLFSSIALVALASALLLSRSESLRLSAEVERGANAFADLFQNQIDVRRADLELAIEILLNDPSVVDVFEARDRDALLAKVRPLFEDTLRLEHEVTQFHFHVPPATSFLRVHRPEQFGDDLSARRSTVVQTIRDRQAVSGLEVSRNGPGLTVVVPVEREGLLIGSVELGSQLTTALDSLADSLAVDYAIGVRESAWEAAGCDELLSPQFVLGSTVYYEASNPWLGEATASWNDPVPGERFAFDGRRFAASNFDIADGLGEVIGSVLVVSDVTASIARVRRELARTLGLIFLLGLGFGALIYSQLNRLILSPLQGSVALARSIEAGDLSSRTNVEGVRETRDLGGSLNRMAEKLQDVMEKLNLRSAEAERSHKEAQSARENAERQKTSLETGTTRLLEGMERFRHGDLTVRVETEDTEELHRLFSGFNHSARELRTMVQQISKIASTAAGATTEISVQAEQMAASAAAQGQRSSEVADGMASVTETAEATARLASKAASHSQVMGEAAREGAETAASTRLGMQKIVDSTEVTVGKIRAVVDSMDYIGQIATVIEDIAKQTNLLALNAAIQAAHAGTYGQGFAIVADEIKKLSEETSRSTRGIRETLEKIRAEAHSSALSVSDARAVVEGARDSVEGLASSMSGIGGSSREMTEIADKVASASALQARRSDSVASFLEGMTSGNDLLANSTAQIADAAEDLKGLTDDLGKAMASFVTDGRRGEAPLRDRD